MLGEDRNQLPFFIYQSAFTHTHTITKIKTYKKYKSNVYFFYLYDYQGTKQHSYSFDSNY